MDFYTILLLTRLKIIADITPHNYLQKIKAEKFDVNFSTLIILIKLYLFNLFNLFNLFPLQQRVCLYATTLRNVKQMR
jgi:hypothetical protein